MDDQIATPEMANFLRASLKMLGGAVMEEKYVVKLVEHSKELLRPLPGCKLRELTPLEVECFVLDFSIGYETARVMGELMVFHSGTALAAEYAKLRYASALNAVSGTVITAILNREERIAREAGTLPSEATGIALEIDNDAICLFAGRVTDKVKSKIANLSMAKAVNTFDLEHWQPSDPSKFN